MLSKYKIRFAPEALDEIQQIVEYYNSCSYGLGNRFKRSLLEAMKSLRTHPAYAAVRYDNVRFASIKKFPYAIHYTVEDNLKIVKIQAVLGYKQNPDTNWKIRF